MLVVVITDYRVALLNSGLMIVAENSRSFGKKAKILSSSV